MTAPLLLVDGHYLLHRAWFGFAARITSRDKTLDRTGVFGFAALLRKAQVQHADGFEIFVVFDSEHGSQARTGQDSDYKARRLENIPADELRPAWTQQWPQALRWREMIKLDTKAGLPDDLLTAVPAAPLPKAAHVLEALGLW
ncbi:hypothetical protein [Actinacidiphila sp. ITFR-21]|uniref:hypothetical protein n=1 Tax=Actinacidiphila sp. ITFR-21 TaxID=3075199 RepID=UPI00288B38D1|nr:hypothetical protein [Streptomyces sp. ITFR-21]WNI19996.1 hypothetical protein RLT57_31130 [Streptomyces sp. ITFR-21]